MKRAVHSMLSGALVVVAVALIGCASGDGVMSKKKGV